MSDPTPVATVGGNLGTTRGAQRLIVLQAAADIWADALDSDVEIVVHARFRSLACDALTATLGSAGPDNSTVLSMPGRPSPLWYVAALADRLTESDTAPGAPDITAEFNGDLDDNSLCLDGSDWYYGLDGQGSVDDINLLNTVLHEFGHGLGFLNLLDEATGAPLDGVHDVYESLTFDLTAQQHWHEMSDEQRVASAINPRQVVLDGVAVRAAVPATLNSGVRQMAIEPPVVGFSEVFGEADFAPIKEPVSGILEEAFPVDACAPLSDLTGRVALIDRGTCSFYEKTEAAISAGAVAVIMVDSSDASPPNWMTSTFAPLDVPVVRVTSSDGAQIRLALAATLTVRFSIDATRWIGADAEGRPYLNATRPLEPGTSISHWDPLAEPSLLMMPYQSPEQQAVLDMSVALMVDIGWIPFVCGDSFVEGIEACDDGNDVSGDGCFDCQREYCGDARINNNGTESCDDGADNSDTRANACRLSCQMARCGDSVVDAGELCDDGNDTAGDGCSACVLEYCGDGVTNNSNEQCDDGVANSDSRPGACRRDCRSFRCGDGVVDDNEQCDDGPLGRDCPADCVLPPVPDTGSPTADSGAEGAPAVVGDPAAAGGCACQLPLPRPTGPGLGWLVLAVVPVWGRRRQHA